MNDLAQRTLDKLIAERDKRRNGTSVPGVKDRYHVWKKKQVILQAKINRIRTGEDPLYVLLSE